MDILIRTTRISSWKNKYKRRDSFRTDKKKVKKISPRMGWFIASGPVEIIYVRLPFITWWSKEVQVDWWIKLHKLYEIKENTKSKVFVGITVKQRNFIIHPEFTAANHNISDQFIQNLKSNPKKVHDLTGEMKRTLKTQRLEKVSNCKYTKLHVSLTIMVKQITMEGHMQTI